ncbi:hypothetical protein F2P79_016461 [Pimephales promelas]|nr:hypothetical protein F2P79_016461 [Pimephales promelas]
MYCMFDCKWQVVQKKFLECTATNLPFLFSVYLHLNGIRLNIGRLVPPVACERKNTCNFKPAGRQPQHQEVSRNISSRNINIQLGLFLSFLLLLPRNKAQAADKQNSMLQENGSYDYLHCINTNDQHKSCGHGERLLVRDAGLAISYLEKESRLIRPRCLQYSLANQRSTSLNVKYCISEAVAYTFLGVSYLCRENLGVFVPMMSIKNPIRERIDNYLMSSLVQQLALTDGKQDSGKHVVLVIDLNKKGSITPPRREMKLTIK